MKINYKLEYDPKIKDVLEIIREKMFMYCDVYFHNANDVCDDVCSNCGTYADECKMYEIVVKFNPLTTLFNFYICSFCAKKNNLLDE